MIGSLIISLIVGVAPEWVFCAPTSQWAQESLDYSSVGQTSPGDWVYLTCE